MSKRAAIYARFSTDKQNDRSIEDQVAFCRTLAARAAFVVVAVFSDRAVSGASTVGRDGWQAVMRAAAGREFDVLLTEDIDRAFRDEADYHLARKRLEFFDVRIHTAAGELDRVGGSVRVMMAAMTLANLAQKTHRGQAGVIRDGRQSGSAAYGYTMAPGEVRGRLEIAQAEASVVRRIFIDYLAGRSPREIAAKLNREGVSGPRGGVWNASTINGSRRRKNGILQNELYAGVNVWNRQRFVKDPDTGKRVSRPNPETEWIRREIPDLAIIDKATFEAVQRRKSARAGSQGRTSAKHLLSGLLKCGCCGSGYVVVGRDKRGTVLGCSRHRETGLCDNGRTLSMARVEAKIISAIETELAAPDVIEEYVREYHHLARLAAADASGRKVRLERRLSDIKRECDAIIDLLLTTPANRRLTERLEVKEKEREEVESSLASAGQDLPIELHPRAASVYRAKVADLKACLTSLEGSTREDAMRIIRELLERIVVRPSHAYGPVELDIHGRLAALLRLPEEAAARGPLKSVGALVAGAGFEPATFRL